MKWATGAVRGNGPATPRFGSLVYSTSGCQVGGWIQMGMDEAQHTPWEWKNVMKIVKGEK